MQYTLYLDFKEQQSFFILLYNLILQEGQEPELQKKLEHVDVKIEALMPRVNFKSPFFLLS